MNYNEDISYESGSGPLRGRLESEAVLNRTTLGNLTVLATQNDPYRQDTPANHRDGRWLADAILRLGLVDRDIHLRGLHYAVLGELKPNGKPYFNTEADWTWLQEDAAKAARWLGYVPFSRIIDARNAEPVIRIIAPETEFAPFLTVGLNIELPDAGEMLPVIYADGGDPRQPYRLAIFGEKSSLRDVLLPVAERFDADLFLPTGEISDTQVYAMAEAAAEDGRELIVFTFSDCDPAGWQMPISIGRKLQAFKDLEFGDLEFQVHRIGLLPEHVREYGLPSTPLKDTEKRADRWQAAMGVMQTEIDALASLRPDILTSIAEDAIGRYYDATLETRQRAARRAWEAEAQQVIEGGIGLDLDQIHQDAAEALAEMEAQIAELNDRIHIDASAITGLPDYTGPEALLDEGGFLDPLIDSAWSFIDQVAALKASKSYDGGGQS